MKCFVHAEHDAVGMCRACGRGVCRECCADLGKSLACRNRCEMAATQVQAMIDYNIAMVPVNTALIRSARRTHGITGIFLLVLGLVCLAVGYHEYTTWGEIGISLFFGPLMLIYGVINLTRTSRGTRPPIHPPGHCQKCGYNLAGNATGRCPECGV